MIALQLDNDQNNAAGGNIRQGLPGPDWTRDELFARAVWEYDRIETGETYSPRYWLLGKFLLVVREAFGPDLKGWQAWRVRAKLINRTRCERSMLLARAFGSPDELERMSVLAALALAAERLGLEPRQTTADARLRRWLTALEKSSRERLDEFSRVTQPDGLRRRIAALIRQLGALDQACATLERRRGPAIAKSRRAKQPK